MQTDRLREMGDKVLEFEVRIKEKFAEIEVKCITITLLYVSYLFRVSREISIAKKLLEELSFNEEN